jgi:hypothetical protein
MADANYNGRQPNNTSYIKSFVEGTLPSLWTYEDFYLFSSNLEVVTTTDIDNVYIPGNLYIGGQIINVDVINPSNNNFLQDLINKSLQPLITTINNLQQKIDDLNAKLNAK